MESPHLHTKTYRARWILPVTGDPIGNGWLTVADGRIQTLGTQADHARPGVDLGSVAILPGLVNAHTHFELSYLRGAVPPSARFTDWVKALIARRSERPDPADPVIRQAAVEGIREARAAGTALVGEVCNSLVTVQRMRDAGLAGRVFHELLGFNAADPEALVRAARERIDALPLCPDIRVGLAPHAPYSVSAALFRAIRQDIDRHPGTRSSVHLGESPEEYALIASGTGPWREALVQIGAWREGWTPPGGTAVSYLADLAFLDRRVLAVHGVQFTPEDLALLASLDVAVVVCPRSNRHVGVGHPPLEAMYAAGLRVAIGTDSLASVADLSVFAELAEARRVAPRVAAGRLLRSATLDGARALGFESEYGSIDVGKRAALIAVDVPADRADVEEYLVAGVEPTSVRWLD